MECDDQDLLGSFLHLSNEYHQLVMPSNIARISTPSTFTEKLNFQREFISRNVPVVITNGVSDWNALSNWSTDYLRKRLDDFSVLVAITPSGRADSVQADRFLLPDTKMMTFPAFVDKLNDSDGPVVYLQEQNDNMRKSMSILLDDISLQSFKWVESLLGVEEPDAINFWMGNERSVSSLHKDHYENFYCVITGTKRFVLYPPCDHWCLYPKDYIAAMYKFTHDDHIIQDCYPRQVVSWCSVDLDRPDFEKFPYFKHAKALEVTLKPGEVLYLPSLWFHQVYQSDETIAVNFWYDMRFDDPKYPWYTFQEKLLPLLYNSHCDI